MLLQIDELGNVTINVADWDINESFPARTITTDYSNWIAYISRKEVPAGVPITDVTYWKPLTRIQTQLLFDYLKFKDEVDKELVDNTNILAVFQSQIEDFRNEMQSFIETASGGEAFSTHFGNSNVMGITQRTLTDAFRTVFRALEEIKGEPMFEVKTIITPDAIIKDRFNTINVKVLTDFAIIDKVKVYIDDVLQDEATSIEAYIHSFNMTDTGTIRVEATVLGQPYITTKQINVYSDFYIGAGDTFEDVYNVEHARDYDGNPQGQYDVTVVEGQRIFIIIPTTEASKIEQIEMNDFNIPMTTSIYEDYTVYSSVNVYQEGNYVIDINY